MIGAPRAEVCTRSWCIRPVVGIAAPPHGRSVADALHDIKPAFRSPRPPVLPAAGRGELAAAARPRHMRSLHKPELGPESRSCSAAQYILLTPYLGSARDTGAQMRVHPWPASRRARGGLVQRCSGCTSLAPPGVRARNAAACKTACLPARPSPARRRSARRLCPRRAALRPRRMIRERQACSQLPRLPALQSWVRAARRRRRQPHVSALHVKLQRRDALPVQRERTAARTALSKEQTVRCCGLRGILRRAAGFAPVQAFLAGAAHDKPHVAVHAQAMGWPHRQPSCLELALLPHPRACLPA
jgi:hypothetical protein